MTIQSPTRITIEIQPPSSEHAERPVQTIVVTEPRQEIPLPAAYEPVPCHCLDDEDCGAYHENE